MQLHSSDGSTAQLVSHFLLCQQIARLILFCFLFWNFAFIESVYITHDVLLKIYELLKN